METKPYSLQAPEQIAKEYGGNKRAIAQAAQQGLLDPTAAILAGMFIDRIRNAAAVEQGPTQTVAQDVMAPPQMGMPSQPPMGLADVPIPENMYEPSYSGGGLIAFEDGGPIKKFKFGGKTLLSPYDVKTASIEDLVRLAEFGDDDAVKELQRRNPASKFNLPKKPAGPGVGPSTPQVTDRFRSGAKPGPAIGPSTPQITDQFRVQKGLVPPSAAPAAAGPPSLINRILDIGKKTFKPVFALDLLTTSSEIDPKNTEANTLSKLKYLEYNAAAMSPEQLEVGQQLLRNPNASVADLHKVLTTQVAGPSGSAQIAEQNTGGAPTPAGSFAPAAPPTGAPAAARAPSIQDAIRQGNIFAEAVYGKEKDIPPVKTMDEAGATLEAALQASGFDPNLLTRQQEQLEADKKSLAQDRKTAMDMRIIEAGLGIMAGTSPNAFVNIGKGATPAVQGLAKDIKELKAAERDFTKAQMDLDTKKNDFALGKAKIKMSDIEKSQERQDRQREKFQTLKAEVGAKVYESQLREQLLAKAGTSDTDFSRKWQLYVQSLKPGEKPTPEGFMRVWGRPDSATEIQQINAALKAQELGMTPAEIQSIRSGLFGGGGGGGGGAKFLGFE